MLRRLPKVFLVAIAIAGLGVTVVPTGAASAGALQDDGTDTDGDGLTDAHERRLGTCPDASSTTRDGWRCDRYPPEDTDGDGLADGLEVTRQCAAADDGTSECLDLPAWGANPRHKDVFVHVDAAAPDFVDKPLGDVFLSAAAADVARAFAAASAETVGNPDGRPGIAVHFDVAGSTRLDLPDNPGVLFDSGQSGLVADCADYDARRRERLGPLRASAMRYWCATTRPAGQASGSRLSMVVNARATRIITHELGHLLGLGHGGRSGLNGQPNYVSLMNYAFQNTQAAFSQGGRRALLPTSLCEHDGLGDAGDGRPIDVLPLAGAPMFLRVDPVRGFVDWDRDGVFQGCEERVEAPITFATWMGTGSRNRAVDRLPTKDLAWSVDGVRLGEKMYVVWSAADGALRARSTRFAGDCVEPRPVDEDRCGEWSAPFDLRADLSSVAGRTLAVLAEPSLLVVEGPGGLRAHRLTAARGDRLRLSNARPLGAPKHAVAGVVPWARSPSSQHARDSGALVVAHARDGSGAVTLIVVDAKGRVLQRARPGLRSKARPTVAVAPHGGTYVVTTDDGDAPVLTLIVDTPDGPRGVTSRRWVFPARCNAVDGCRHADELRVVGRPAVAFERGRLVLVHHAAKSGALRVLELPPSDRAGLRPLMGLFGGAWGRVDVHAGISLFRGEGARLHGVSAFVSDGPRIAVYPYADGIFDRLLEDTNDFEVMEAGICWPWSRPPWRRACRAQTEAPGFRPAPLGSCSSLSR